jgi:DNA-binding CsgD family transcriptional regulator
MIHQKGSVAMNAYIHLEIPYKIRVLAVQKPCPLSERQLECVRWMAEGKTASEIAEIIGVAKATAQKHIFRAREMCGSAKDTSLVATAIRSGWID